MKDFYEQILKLLNDESRTGFKHVLLKRKQDCLVLSEEDGDAEKLSWRLVLVERSTSYLKASSQFIL